MPTLLRNRGGLCVGLQSQDDGRGPNTMGETPSTGMLLQVQFRTVDRVPGDTFAGSAWGGTGGVIGTPPMHIPGSIVSPSIGRHATLDTQWGGVHG